MKSTLMKSTVMRSTLMQSTRLASMLFAGSVAATGLLLGACGGGSSVTDYFERNYAAIPNNANGADILDGKNEKFQVLERDRMVVAAKQGTITDSGLTLTSLKVDAALNVLDHDQPIGKVAVVPVNGANVAVFLCTNGQRMTINYQKATGPSATYQIAGC